jgi:putative ATP-dependent endonuclease of OLD family
MEYHGMGTRSWSSILSFKTFLEVLSKKAENEQKLFYPIIAIEEPETHLHPNAQKQIYNQLKSFPGIKIITTHSPYIVTSAKLNEIRNIYKIENKIYAGNLLSINTEENRQIRYKVIKTNGELIFSKCIILFEGETEEVVLPVLFKKYFNYEPYELGVNFIGVNGYGKYVPFIKFAENLNIPFLIFSDNDKPNNNDIKGKVIKQVRTSSKNPDDIIIFLNDGNDIEKELIETDEYENIIKNAILNSIEYKNERHKEAKFEKNKKEIFSKSKEEILHEMRKHKTKYAYHIANEIDKADNINFPEKIEILFEKIKKIIG